MPDGGEGTTDSLVDQSKIERRFVTKDEVDQVKGFDPKTIEVTNKVLQLVESLLQIKFNDFQYLALSFLGRVFRNASRQRSAFFLSFKS